MDKQAITEKVLEFVRKALANRDAEIDADAPLKDQGLNSSGRLELFTILVLFTPSFWKK